MPTKCYCGSSKSFSNCCKLIHENIFEAKTAEQLMRSRYTAFVLANGDYLQKSHSEKTRPNANEQKELIRWTKSVEWFKLEVFKTEKGKENDSVGSVEFKAYFYSNGNLEMIYEKSSFMKENGHWVYFGILD